MVLTVDRKRLRLSIPQRAAAGLTGALCLALAGLAFTGMFTAVKKEMIPFFGHLAWIVPAGVDIGILALISAGILLEWLAMPMPSLRWVAMTFMGASVYLNVAAAKGSPVGSVGHAALPVLFIACIEAVRHAVRRTAGMANGTLRDGIPVARWILDPWGSFLMHRRMVLQRINSYPEAVVLEISRRNAVAQLRDCYGTDWRRMAPGHLVWMLRKGQSVADAVIRVAEMTGSPVPGALVPGTGPGLAGDRRRDRKPDRSGDQAGTGVRDQRGTAGEAPAPGPPRSLDELQREALKILAAHRAETGQRMGNKPLARALRVSNGLCGEIRHQIRDREEAVA